MAFSASPTEILGRLAAVVEAALDVNWAAEPPAARAALLAREELEGWTRSNYPGSSCEGAALDPGSRRRLSLVIHSAPATHRVEVWGSADGDAGPNSPGAHTCHSWVVLVHVGKSVDALKPSLEKLIGASLNAVAMVASERLHCALLVGSIAPDGCPDCAGKPP